MIKGLSGGIGVIVSGGSTSLPYVSTNQNNPMQGMLRINGNDMQVFDGNNWMTLGSSYASVTLDSDTQSLLQWAREQRTNDVKRAELIKNNPALQKAYEAIKRSEANFDILSKFVENDERSNVQAGL